MQARCGLREARAQARVLPCPCPRHCGSRLTLPVADDALPGASLDGVLAIARRLSPELAARALEVEAAQARVEIAGSWNDPTLRVTSDEIDRTGGPRQNKMIYSVEQDIPLWGKLDLKRDAARAEVDRMAADGTDAPRPNWSRR